MSLDLRSSERDLARTAEVGPQFKPSGHRGHSLGKVFAMDYNWVSMATAEPLPVTDGSVAPRCDLPSESSQPQKQDEQPRAHLRLDADTASQIPSIEQSLLICGRADEALDLLPEDSVQTVVTSPPYWSLRDYGASGQIGRDDRLSEYLDSLVLTFRKVRRTLRPDGTLWLNIGDSYTSGNRRYRAPDRKNVSRTMDVRPPTPEGLKPKDLIGVPWRVAHALQEDGWWLRSEVIWYKPNAHPESVRDRPTKAHENLFLFSKGLRYHYDVEAVKGPNDRRLRSVWEIPTEPQPTDNGAGPEHPAVMPIALARRCLRLTAKKDGFVLDPYAGSGTTLRAAGEAGCSWIGIEIKRAFVDLIESRLDR